MWKVCHIFMHDLWWTVTVAGSTIIHSWWRFFYTIFFSQLLQIVNDSREDVDYMTTHWLTSLQTLKNGGDNDNDVLSSATLASFADDKERQQWWSYKWWCSSLPPFVVCHLPGTHSTSFSLVFTLTHRQTCEHTHALTLASTYTNTHSHMHLHLQTTHCQTHTQTYSSKNIRLTM